MEDLAKKLRQPFDEKDIKWRVQQGGISKTQMPYLIMIPYIDARAIQRRLDEVVGIDKWKNEFTPIDGGFMCGISICINDNWVTKWDGAQRTNIEGIKGGLSDAQKRAAV